MSSSYNVFPNPFHFSSLKNRVFFFFFFFSCTYLCRIWLGVGVIPSFILTHHTLLYVPHPFTLKVWRIENKLMILKLNFYIKLNFPSVSKFLCRIHWKLKGLPQKIDKETKSITLEFDRCQSQIPNFLISCDTWSILIIEVWNRNVQSSKLKQIKHPRWYSLLFYS